jgi:hypothetical protein
LRFNFLKELLKIKINTGNFVIQSEITKKVVELKKGQVCSKPGDFKKLGSPIGTREGMSKGNLNYFIHNNL